MHVTVTRGLNPMLNVSSTIRNVGSTSAWKSACTAASWVKKMPYLAGSDPVAECASAVASLLLERAMHAPGRRRSTGTASGCDTHRYNDTPSPRFRRRVPGQRTYRGRLRTLPSRRGEIPMHSPGRSLKPVLTGLGSVASALASVPDVAFRRRLRPGPDPRSRPDRLPTGVQGPPGLVARAPPRIAAPGARPASPHRAAAVADGPCAVGAARQLMR